MELQTNFQEAVGLFGTCGGSTWREAYYQFLNERDIPLFDPQIMPATHGREWCEADIENEIRHLDQNPILMFKVTGETTGLRSLLEVVRAVQNPNRYMIVLIESLWLNYADFGDDPRLHALTAMLTEQGMKVPNILKDVHGARSWTREEVTRVANQTTLVTLVHSDEQALAMIEAMYAIVKIKQGVAVENSSDISRSIKYTTSVQEKRNGRYSLLCNVNGWSH